MHWLFDYMLWTTAAGVIGGGLGKVARPVFFPPPESPRTREPFTGSEINDMPPEVIPRKATLDLASVYQTQIDEIAVSYPKRKRILREIPDIDYFDFL